MQHDLSTLNAALRESGMCEVAIVRPQDCEKFTATLRQIKKVENIKNNATAVQRMADLAQMQLSQMSGATE